MAVKVIIYWITKDEASIAAIRKHFNISTYTTINGYSPAEIDENDIPMLDETAKRGFIRYWREEWKFNGTTYTW